MSEKKSAKLEPPKPEEVNPVEAADKDLLALSEQLQKVSEERDGYKDQLLRTMADFQNFRKRVRDEQRQIEERANERLIVDLLPVLEFLAPRPKWSAKRSGTGCSSLLLHFSINDKRH